MLRCQDELALAFEGTVETEPFPLKFYLSLEYTISKALSNYAELDFKDKGQSSFTGDVPIRLGQQVK